MKFSFSVLFFFLTSLLLAQTKVSGVLKDASGEGVAYANVIFKDSREGTITNEEGRFYLESDKTYTEVVFSFIGYTTKSVSLEKRSTYDMNIVLEESEDALDEVVIYAGKTSKKDNPALDILRKIWENR